MRKRCFPAARFCIICILYNGFAKKSTICDRVEKARGAGAEPARARQGAMRASGWGLYRSEAFVFAPALVSTSLEMTGRKSVTLGLRADEGVRPYHVLPKVSTGIVYLSAAGRGRPALPRRWAYSKQILAIGGSLSAGRGTPLPSSINRYICYVYNVISTEAIAERRNPLRLSSDLVSATTVFNVHSRGFDKKFAKRQKIRAIFLISARL